MPDLEARLRPVNYYLIATAAWFASFGMQSVVFQWLVTIELRQPAELVGLAQTALLLPSTLFLLFAGANADRVGPARQAMWAQAGAGLIPWLLIVPLMMGELTYTVTIVYALAMGCAQAVVTPSRDGLLNQVAEGHIQKTVMQASLAQFSFQILGYSFAGLADRLGGDVILIVQSGVLLIGVWSYRSIRRHSGDAARAPQGRDSGVLADVWEGAVTVMTNPIMRVVVLQNVAMAFCFMGAFVVALPLVVRDVFAGSSGDIATLSAFNSLGLVATILIMLRVGYVMRPGRALVLSQGVGTFALFAAGSVDSFPLFVTFVFMWGLCGGLAMPMCRTLMQELAPRGQLGRVMSFFSFSFMGAAPVGTLLLGYLAGRFGPQAAIQLCAATMFFVMLLVWLFSPLWSARFTPGQAAEAHA